jgi:hypothetical protein
VPSKRPERGRKNIFQLLQFRVPRILLWRTTVAVEKGTKAVISANFSVYGRRTFNNLQTNFVV